MGLGVRKHNEITANVIAILMIYSFTYLFNVVIYFLKEIRISNNTLKHLSNIKTYSKIMPCLNLMK